MIYEMRLYDCCPGKLPALQKRFENVTLALWDKYGIRQVGFWTTLIGPSSHRLTYMIAWESLAERETKWTAFQSDPEWIAKRNASETDGPILVNIESSLLLPTAFSKLK
jgi:NIPSNAP